MLVYVLLGVLVLVLLFWGFGALRRPRRASDAPAPQPSEVAVPPAAAPVSPPKPPTREPEPEGEVTQPADLPDFVDHATEPLPLAELPLPALSTAQSAPMPALPEEVPGEAPDAPAVEAAGAALDVDLELEVVPPSAPEPLPVIDLDLGLVDIAPEPTATPEPEPALPVTEPVPAEAPAPEPELPVIEPAIAPELPEIALTLAPRVPPLEPAPKPLPEPVPEPAQQTIEPVAAQVEPTVTPPEPVAAPVSEAVPEVLASPVATPVPPVVALPSAPALPTPALSPPAATEPPLILVVDDSAVVRAKMVKLLKSVAYRVEIAKNGVQALELIPQLQPHIIVTDIEMPEMDGYELIARLDADPALRAIPVFAVSSFEDLAQRLAPHANVKGCFGKPWDEPLVLATLASLVGVPAAAA